MFSAFGWRQRDRARLDRRHWERMEVSPSRLPQRPSLSAARRFMAKRLRRGRTTWYLVSRLSVGAPVCAGRRDLLGPALLSIGFGWGDFGAVASSISDTPR